MSARLKRSIGVLLALATCVCAADVRLRAQDRFLGKEDIILLGLGLTVAPEHQTVPRDIATIVSTFLSAATQPQNGAPPFAPDAVIKATLRGPGVGNGLALTAAPNTAFDIPPLSTAGTYTLDEIRLESGGEILMRGTPESVTIEVIEKLLVTQVTARALTAQEIREKGIVFDSSNFQAYNFTAAFAVQDNPINISFPVLLPTLKNAQDVALDSFSGGGVLPGPTLPQLKTIIPDTLKLQTQIPNLQVVGFTLTVGDADRSKNLVVPPIPGIVVIPGDIGFLNQMFSVMLLVGNVAPEGSGLVVDNLTGEIHLPAGNDTVIGSDDDPLRLAMTANGPAPGIKFIAQAGADGKLGSADDVMTLAPGANGSAEYLVEGRREGTWVVEFNIAGTLHGLPVGPVNVTGRAAGSVLVRNPSFTLTFTHPEVVTAGEAYSLDVTVSNTSDSPANFVSVNLHQKDVTGATVVGDPARQIDSIPAGESATVSFDLVSRVTGKVTAATLDTEDKVAGRFALKTAVGELGVPLSPDSLVLPAEANTLPASLRTEVLGLLGKAWAVATSPAVALPKDVKRLSKQIVFDRAVQTAEAGFRIRLHEPMPDSVAQLAMDFIGSDFARLGSFHTTPDDLQFARNDYIAFDDLRRRSVRGDGVAAAVGSLLTPNLTSLGAAAFHQAFAEKVAYRPQHLSVLAVGNGPLPYTISLVDAQGRRVGRADAKGKVIKEIPFGDLVPFTNAGGTLVAQMIVLAAPDAGDYHVQFDPVAGVAATEPFALSLIVPTASGGLRHVVYSTLTAQTLVASPFGPGDPYHVVVDLPLAGGAQGPAAPSVDAAIVAPPPHVIGVVQQADKDVTRCEAIPLGRVLAVLFSSEVTAESVQDRRPASDITNFAMVDNRVVGVSLQPGRRIAFFGLRDGVGPFVPRSLTLSNVMDAAGRTMAAETAPVEMTAAYIAAVVNGRVIEADGSPVPFADMRFIVWDGACGPVGVSAKPADDKGAFSWDYIPQGVVPEALSGPITLDGISPDRISAMNPATGDGRRVNFSVQRNGQRLNVNVVFLGRGTLKGQTLAEDNTPLKNTIVRATSLTDQSTYGATTDENGQFVFARVPVGNVFLEAVNEAASAKGSVSSLIPLAGATVVTNVRMFDRSSPTVTIKYGTATGHVLKGDGSSPASGVTVFAYYRASSQPGVKCPNVEMFECAVGVARTDATGRFSFDQIPAGQIRLATFDESTLQQGEASVLLAADGTVDANILLAQGLGTVNGSVVDSAGVPIAGARVGGGLSLTVTDASGHFVLTDVPVGRREIVAVEDQGGTRGAATIDILQAGQVINVTVVLPAFGTVLGTVFESNGVTPVPNQTVYLFYYSELDSDHIQVIGSAATDAAGKYSFEKVPLRPGYVVSAFRSNFSDGNIKPIVLKFANQVVRGDIVFRGGGGHVTGRVLDANGTTPLAAVVGVSGDRLVVAGGLIGTKFQHVVNYQVVNTDIATGTFQFNNVFVGPFALNAAGQFSPDPIGATSTMPSAGATVTLDLRLQATSKIEGTVYQPDGVTPVGRNVLVKYKSSAFKVVCATAGTITVGTVTIPGGECADVPQGIQDETVITDDAGHYLLPLVNGGPFTLTVEDPATGRTGQTVGSIKPGQLGDFPVRLLGVSTVVIKVRGSDTTTPIPGARVEVTQVSFPKKTLVAAADATGTLTLSGGDAFTEGDLAVLATDVRNGFAGRASGKVSKDGDVVTITVFLYNASGRVFGVVLKPDGLTPVPNAEVVISNAQGPLAFALTDADGSYEQEMIPLGAFRVDAFEAATARRGFASGRIDLDQQAVPVDVVEAGRGLVTGIALTEGSLAPLKNWQVFLTQLFPGGGRTSQIQTSTDVDGTFSLPGVLAGDFTILIGNANARPGDPVGQGQATARLETDGQHLDIPVLVHVIERKYGRVEGTVLNPDGTPAANLAVDLCPTVACSSSSASGHVNTQTAADGSFVFDHALIGRFIVRAQSQVTLNAASTEGDLLFEGDLARVTLQLVGVSAFSGVVVRGDGSPAPNVSVTLIGQPSSGCPLFCTTFTGSDGAFAFINVPARTFTMLATDAVSGLKGSISGTLNPGDLKVVRIVLQPTTAVSGRVLSAAGAPAPRITVALIGTVAPDPVQLFAVTGDDGQFSFPAVVNGTYTLTAEDAFGPGIAKRSVQVVGALALGDITLDDAVPSVASQTPQASAIGVALNTPVRVVFSEPVSIATVTQANISLTGPAGAVLGTLQLVDGDTTALFTPLNPLVQNTRYSLSVRAIADRIGKLMTPYAASFTTIDLVAPQAIDLAPASGSSGIALNTVVRVKFSEPIDPARFRGPPIILTKGAAVVPGRIDYILGNTTVVFVPTGQLEENSDYLVQVEAAVDLAGNTPPQGLVYQFHTLDRTPPNVVSLTAAGDGTVIENGITQVVADVGTSHDIAVVDFYINDQPSAPARTAPFTFSFQALASLGKPGDKIKISALATDTSGNRGVTPAVALVTVVADKPPVATITSPAAGTQFHTGDRVSVTVHVTDDLGARQVSYRAQTGKPQDAGTESIAPASLDFTRTFAFTIGADAVPGAPIALNASAVDSKGQVANAAAVSISVVDATLPLVSITGTTTGAKVSPGQQTSAVVSATDLGGIASVSFTTGGVLVGTQTRAVAPAQPAVVTSFAFTVPATAHAGDTLTLDATATDAAGNTASAGRVLLPIADLNAPSIQLRTASGSLELTPGVVVNVVADATDETGVATIALAGQGAFSVTQAQQVSPISNSPQLVFAIPVPSGVTDGAVLNISATATDIFGNVSAPATLALTVRSLTSVVLPSSLLVAAGEPASFDVQLTGAAPAAGLRVDLASTDITVAQVTSAVQFAAGETTKQAVVTGLRGGTASITASLNGVQRATTTVVVRGGVVSGIVYDPQLQPVAGAQVLVTSAGVGYPTLTNTDGSYHVEGVGTGFQGSNTFTVKVADPVSGRIGYATGTFAAQGGFAHVNVVLVSAGTIAGTITTPDGHTPTGAGASVKLFASTNPSAVVATTATDENGAFEFPIVTPGIYVVEASDASGNRGRSAPITVTTTGQRIDVVVAYLGRGSIVGVVRDGAGNPAGNVPLTLTGTSLFGSAPIINVNAAQDGTFRFDGVLVGAFTLQARDPVSNFAAVVSGNVLSDQQVVSVTLRLTQSGALEGIVFNTDGVTPVVGASVTLSSSGTYVQTKTDSAGRYAFAVVPLGGYFLEARELTTHGIGRVTGTLVTHGLTVTQNISLFAQGSFVVTVTDGSGNLVGGATVTISSSSAQAADTVQGLTGADGVALVEHVLASNQVWVSASANRLSGGLLTTLAANELKHVTVALEPTASILGTLFQPDGQTPVTDGFVAPCDGCAKVPVNPDGTFRFDLTLRTWDLFGYDGQNRKRALARGVVLNQNAQLVTANMTFIGLGTVSGRVLNPDNSSAPNLQVTLRSLDPDFGGFHFPQTDAGGFYEAQGVVVGTVALSTGDVTRGLLGEASGALAHDGDTLTIDVLLKNNAITLPVTKPDGNAFTFDVQKDGSVGAGYNVVFASVCCGAPSGASHLDVIVNGSANRFNGATIGTTEDGGREVVVSQAGLAGLNVTRKVLVSPTFFARYLELLTNPTGNPITVDLRVLSAVRAQQILTTSSGDAVLDVSSPSNPDRWLMLDTGADVDPFESQFSTSPQVGFGFDGAGALRSSTEAAFAPVDGFTQLKYQWNAVTIQPGQTVAFMHFAVQQYSRAAAQASLDRLAQLPPEALTGLSQVEIAAIQNFAVPADGTSPVAPLPGFGGTITGNAFEGDRLTPFSSVNQFGSTETPVRFRSGVIFFGRSYWTSTTATGGFTFGANITVPKAAFTLDALHSRTKVASPPTAGDFATGALTANADVVFSNTGMARGTVRRSSGAVVSGATITAATPTSLFTFPTSATDGRYSVFGLLPGSTTVTAAIAHSQNPSFTLKAVGTVAVVAGEVKTTDLTIPATGVVTGVVTTAAGPVSPNTLVRLYGIDPANTFAALQTFADTGGVYRFTDVPAGAMTVRVNDPITQVITNVPAVVVGDQTTTVNVSMLAIGSVVVTARFTNGQPAQGAFIEVQQSAVDQFFRGVGSTDVNGRFTIANAPGGAFIVRAHRPGGFSFVTVDTAGSVTAHGQAVPIDVVLPPLGTVVVRALLPGGTPFPGVRVDSDYQSPGFLQTLGTSDANGELTIANVVGGKTFRVRATPPLDGSDYREAVAQLTGEAQVLTVTVVLNTTGTLSGRVTFADGTPAAHANVLVRTDVPQRAIAATTDQTGAYTVPGVPVSAFRAVVTDLNSTFGASFVGRFDDNGQTITADLALTDLRLPVTLSDANAFSYRVGGSGHLGQNGGVNSSDGFDDAFALSLAPAGGALNYGFEGDNLATPELQGRQLTIRDFGAGVRLAPTVTNGLTVARKVYVSDSGYFARYLEILENPTAAPIAIDLQLRSTFNSTRVTTTSSGDNLFTTPDQWYVTDAPTFPKPPAVARVVAGPGAAVAASVSQPSVIFQVFPTERWNGIVVPAGGRAIVMHFGVQEMNAAAAQAAAERLVQLPPEALAGLTLEERVAIVNFAVPADGSSTIAPFAAVAGIVRGADGSTPVAGARVVVTASAASIFKQPVSTLTGADGRYRLETLGVGPFSVHAIDAVTGVITPTIVGAITADGETATANLTFTGAGALRGSVQFADGTLATGGGHGTWYSSGVVFIAPLGVYAPIGPDGTFKVSAIPPGVYTLQWQVQSSVQFVQPRFAVVSNVVVADGLTTVADIRLQALAAISVTIKGGANGNTPIAGAFIYSYDNAAPSGRYVGQTNASGQVSFQVPEGGYQLVARASDNVTVLAQGFGSITGADDGRVIEVVFQLVDVTISGRIFAGDGVSPAVSASVELLDVNGQPVAFTGAGLDGTYQFSGIRLTAGPSFKVVAHSPADSSVTAEATGTYAGTPLTIDLVLPVSTVTGTVSFPDGVTPVAGGDIRATREDAEGNLQSLSAAIDAQGHYVLVGLPVGEHSLLARDANGVLTGRANVTVSSPVAHMVRDLQVGASGTVTGTLRDGGGAVVPNAYISAVSDGAPSYASIYVPADANGHFTIERVPVGGFTLSTCGGTPYFCGSGRGVVSANGEIVQTDITLPAAGSVTGTILGADGVTPVPNALIYVAGDDTYAGTYSGSTQSDAGGHYAFLDVPAGLVTLTVYNSETFDVLGHQQGTLNAGTSFAIDVVLGGVAPCARALDGTDGFRYSALCSADLEQGGTVDGRLSGAYSDGYALRVNGSIANSSSAAHLEMNGRQVAYPQHGQAGVVSARKLFVPASGGFARYLDTISNPSAVPVTVEVQIESSLRGAVHHIVEPGVTGNTYAVTLASRSSQGDGEDPGPVIRPALAHVFANANATIPVDAVSFQRLDGTSYYRWTVTIPAGGSVTLMHFAVQRDPTDIAGAEAQAQALVSLTDPNALAGMTPAEKALVVNFKVQ